MKTHEDANSVAPRRSIIEAVADLKPAKRRQRRAGNSGGRERKQKRGTKGPRRFPANTLQEAFQVATAIKEHNGGNSWSSAEVAKAVGLSLKNPKFFYLCASARDYGLTTGSRDSAAIALTDLGRRFVYAKSPQEEAVAARDALLNIEAFKGVFTYYKGAQLPEPKYLSNTLESQFQLPTRLHDEFAEFYKANCAYLAKYSERDGVNLGPLVSEGSQAIVVGEPKNKTALRAFVAMPFSEKTGKYPSGFFEEVLRNLITPAGVEAGFKVETAKRDGSDIIQSTIVNELLRADLVIVDLTEHNPNVLFELGLRIAFEKPIALIRAEGTTPIFDVDAMMRVSNYSPELWKTTLEADIPKLTAHIRGAWEGRDDSPTWLKLLKKA